jgi:arylsulfatase
MTGLHPHMAGIGWMTDRHLGYDGYAGDLSHNAVTIAEVLKKANYSTYMSGKWHLVRVADCFQNGDKKNWPLQRGFDSFFGTINGAGNFWNPNTLKFGNDSISAKDYNNFFYTDMIASYTNKFIKDHKNGLNKDNPFFAYVAFTAPHWPLHARQGTIQKYMNYYERGWDVIREERYQRMIKMGIIKSSWKLTERDGDVPAWDSLNDEEKKLNIKRMAIYAAMVDEMDQAVGEILKCLISNNQLDNTLILFMSDNGACAENISGGEKSFEALGTSDSFESYRLPWANVGNTPFRLYKHWLHEGGIATPLIVHWPEKIKDKGALRNQPHYLIDIMATCLELANVTYPTSFKGNSIHKTEGISIIPSFFDLPAEDRYMFWEHEANRAVRKGKWKIVSKANYTYPFINDWELYNLEDDRTEINNLASLFPEVVVEMSKAWDDWAESNRVYPLDGRIHGDRVRNPVFKFPVGTKMPY